VLTKSQVEERLSRFSDIYDMYLSGSSYSQIGAKYGITKERVRQILKSYCTAQQYAKVRERIEQRCLSTYLGKEIIAQLEAGHSCSQVAKNLSCSLSLVKRVSAKKNKEKNDPLN
jgi:DNA invertase Pin-like site-specific DNA recombinase